MTERAPGDDTRRQDREEVALSSDTVGRPASAHGQVGSMALQGEPEGPTGAPELVVTSPEDLALSYEAGVEPKARSQWAYARIRFFRHKMAVISLFVLIAIGIVAIFAEQVAPYGYDELDLFNTTSPPTLEDKHLFGTDLLGRDYLSRVIFGLRTSLWVALFVAFLSTTIGTTDRCARGLLRRRRRQPADALHRPDPDAARTGRPADRGRTAREPQPAQGRPHPRVPLLDGARADRARHLPLASGEGVRRGGQGERRQQRCGSSSDTCFRTRSGRSSSTRR